MKIEADDGTLFINQRHFCRCEAGNGRDDLPNGNFEVATQFSHVHGKVLPDAIGLGWIGASHECDCVLGSVLGRTGVIPSQGALSRLLAMLEVAEGNGSAVWLEVVK